MLYYVLWVSARLFNKGRLPQNCIHTACVSLRFLDAIPRNDGVYIAGIKNNTRGVVGMGVNVALCSVGARTRNKHVTLRRGIRCSEGCTLYLCPNVRVYRCVTSVRVVISQGKGVILRVVGISAAVNKGRLPRNCIASMWLSVKFDDAIPRNDGVYMRVLFLIPAGGWL